MKANNKNSIGQRIKNLRELKNITQSELGKKLFVSDKTISKWEKDKSEPETSILIKIAEIFNVTLDYLIKGKELVLSDESISKIELACREDNIALLDGIDLDLFDKKGKNIEYYIDLYKANKIRQFYLNWKLEKLPKESFSNKTYYLCGIPKDLTGEENLKVLGHSGSQTLIVSKSAQLEKDGYHDFKVLQKLDVNSEVHFDYQYFWTDLLDIHGCTNIIFSTALCDDFKSGILEISIVPESSNGSKQSIARWTRHYIKPESMKKFMDLLSYLDIKNWENKHWGVPMHNLFYVLKETPKDNALACHKFYVSPGKDKYNKLVKGIQELFLETLTPSEYKTFINSFNTTYSTYYRSGLDLEQSEDLFEEIENEKEEIEEKKFFL